jgi:hypothetical protein
VALIDRVHYCDCPIQKNGFDCGLFAVGVVLHLIEGIDVTRETFRQQDITNLRSTLVTVFGGDGADLGTTSQVVRDCFPQLRGSSILDSFGLEVVHKETKKERRLSSDSDVSAAVVVLTTLQVEAVCPSRVSKVSSAKTTLQAEAVRPSRVSKVSSAKTTLQAEAVRPSRVSKVSSAQTTDRAQARIEKTNENHNDNDDKAEGDDDDDEYVTCNSSD